MKLNRQQRRKRLKERKNMRKVFTIWDEKVGAYLDPMTCVNKGEALRIMSEVLTNPEHKFSKFSQDFTLFEIGDYDEITGTLIPYKKGISVAGLHELKAQQSNGMGGPARGPQPDPAEIRAVN
jgi:hypothetical protein